MEGHSDQISQQKENKYIATVLQNKLLVQINDNVTYKGQILKSPYFDINELKIIFQKGQIQVLNKTTSKMTIKLTGLKIQLESQEKRQLIQLKHKIQALQTELKNSKSSWIEENLDSKDNFDIGCIYTMLTTNGSLTSVAVTPSTIYFMVCSTSYTTSCSNRRSNTTSWAVTKLLKCKM